MTTSLLHHICSILRISAVLLLLNLSNVVIAQSTNNLGLAFVRTYSKSDYGGGTQSWAFSQNDKNELFVANNNGLLYYDGTSWELFPLPNHTIARSLSYNAKQQRLYIGGQDAFGYFSVTPTSDWGYNDLKHLLPPEEQQFADVWHIADAAEKGVFFLSKNQVYQIREDEGVVHRFSGAINYLEQTPGAVIAHEIGGGLHSYQQGTFSPMSGTSSLSDKIVTKILAGEVQSTYWIITQKNGIYYWSNGILQPFTIQHQEWLSQRTVQSATFLNPHQLCVATNDAGLLVVDLNNRRIEQWYNKQNSISNNNIRSLFLDQQGGLWLGLDNGIDYVDFSSPFRKFVPDPTQESTTYAIQIFEDQLYVGNSMGLYVAPWKNYYDPVHDPVPFTLIAGSEGQVWNLSKVNNRLWMGHDKGAFQVKNQTITLKSKDNGYWKFLSIDTPDGPTLMAGNYEGLREYNPDTGTFLPATKLEESARILAKDNQNNLWIAHPYRGVYRVDASAGIDQAAIHFYGAEKGLPSDLENYTFSVFRELLVCAERGLYRYDEKRDSFVIEPNYTAYFSAQEQIRRLAVAPDSSLWYISQQEAGWLELSRQGLNTSITQWRLPQIRQLLVPGFEQVYPYDKQNVFFGAENGVIHLAEERLREQIAAPPKITLAQVYDRSNNSLPASDATSNSSQHSSHAFSINFSFALPYFGALAKTEYQYYLSELAENYSEWSTSTSKEYTNLPPGTYTLFCRVRINGGAPSPVSNYTFTIAPPWYATVAAKVVYLMTILMGLLLLIVIPRRRFAQERAALEREQEQQVIEYEQTVEANSQEIDQLKAEGLQRELVFHNKELADMTMHLVQKNELIHRIGQELNIVRKKLSSKDQQLLSPLQQLLNEDEMIENDWEQFVYHFDQVHNGFFQRLRKRYPELTPRDHRLCAYLRMNLSTKDIAPLLNISVRGVEISRYRLRKKLALAKEDNLGEFMMNF